VAFLDEWERALGIPDDCFDLANTDDERRINILTKLAALGVQTEHLVSLSFFRLTLYRLRRAVCQRLDLLLL